MVKRSVKLHEKLRHEVFKDPAARAEYEAFKLQLEVADQLKSARKKANMTQDKVAEKMDTLGCSYGLM